MSETVADLNPTSPDITSSIVDVIVCAGQSNMRGYGYGHELPGVLTYPHATARIFENDRLRALAPGAGKYEGGFGPELSFGHTFAARAKRPIVLIKLSKGGTNLAHDWCPPPPPTTNSELTSEFNQASSSEINAPAKTASAFSTQIPVSDQALSAPISNDEQPALYRKLMHAITRCCQQLTEEGLTPCFRGFFWYQGESDCETSENAHAYYQRLKAFLERVRYDLNAPKLPCVLVRVNPLWDSLTTHRDPVRGAIMHVAGSDNHAAWIDIDDLYLPDRLHLDSSGLLTTGDRAAERLLDLTPQEDYLVHLAKTPAAATHNTTDPTMPNTPENTDTFVDPSELLAQTTTPGNATPENAASESTAPGSAAPESAAPESIPQTSPSPEDSTPQTIDSNRDEALENTAESDPKSNPAAPTPTSTPSPSNDSTNQVPEQQDETPQSQTDNQASDESSDSNTAEPTRSTESTAESTSDTPAQTPVAQVPVTPTPKPSPSLPAFKKPDQTRVIALINQKGGVGKTTTTVNLGAALAQRGQRVLLVDLDPQAHLTLSIGVDPDQLEKTVYDLMTDDDVTALQVCQEINPNLAIIPADVNLAGAEAELAPKLVTGTAQIVLKQKCQSLYEAFDYVLIDCPPALGLLTINGLTLANEVIVPMQAHFLALQGLGKLLETVSMLAQGMNPTLKVSGVTLCMHEGNTVLAGEVVSEVESFLEQARGSNLPWANAVVYSPAIRRNIKLAEAPSFGQSVFDYAPESNGAADYTRLAESVAEQPSI